MTAKSALRVDGALTQILDEKVIATGAARHATCGYVSLDKRGWRWVGAGASHCPVDQPFDLASLTKPCSAIAASEMVRRGIWTFETPVRHILTELTEYEVGQKTIGELLSHRSGLKAHLQLFRRLFAHHPIQLPSLRECIAGASRRENATQPLYSDLGYLLVGFALEREFDKALDHVLFELLFAPWGLRMGSARAWMAHMPSFRADVAPTSIRAERGGVVRGTVHDDNAWTLGGTGCCGHAGLFGNLESILRLGARVLMELQRRESHLVPLYEKRLDGTLRMGFDGINGACSSAGTRAGPDTFGHLGFTGTSLWIDPDQMRATALLTNRVYPTHDNLRLRAIRPQIHDFLWAC